MLQPEWYTFFQWCCWNSVVENMHLQCTFWTIDKFHVEWKICWVLLENFLRAQILYSSIVVVFIVLIIFEQLKWTFLVYLCADLDCFFVAKWNYYLSQTKFVAIIYCSPIKFSAVILVLWSYCAIVCLINFSSNIFNFSSSKTV